MFGADATPEEVDALRDENGRLPPDAFRRLRAQRGKRGPGRPLGSINKRSEQLAKLVIQEFGDPVLGGASLYHMPLDQLCEMLLVADGSTERENRMEEMTGELAAQVKEMGLAVALAAKTGDVGKLTKAADRLADAAESLEAMKKAGGKAGGLALQALNVQLMARRFVAEYVHSKRPTAVDVTHRTDGVLVLGRAGQADGEAEFLSQKVNAALRSGAIEPDQVAALEFRDGKLFGPEGEAIDADFEPVEDDDE